MTGSTGATGAQGPYPTGAVTDSALNRCIDDVLEEIQFELSMGDTGSAGSHSHWYEGATEYGHTHRTIGRVILSTPWSC